MGRIRRSAWPATVIATFALLASACGAPGGDEPAPGDAATDAATSEDTVEEPETDGGAGGGEAIKIGVLAPTTGNVAASGQDMLDGWNLYWNQNDSMAGGVEVETIHEDSAGDPSTGLNKAQRLAGNEGVDFIVGPLLANVGLAVSEEMSREGVPVFHPIASADNLTQREPLPGIIRIAGWTSSQTTHPFGEWAYEQGHRRVATLCTDYAFGQENCGGFVNTFTDMGGEVVEQLWHPLGTQDFSTYISQIQGADPDAVFVLTVGAESPRVIQAWTDFGLRDNIAFLGGETTLDQSLLRNMGSEAVGLMSTGHYAAGRDAAATQDFVEVYDQTYGQLPSYYSAAMYTAAQWVAQAIEQVNGDLSDQETFLEAVRSVQLDETPMGQMELDEYNNPIENVYIREVQEREGGGLWNVPIETYESVSQFWTYDPQEFLDHPVYSREYQGNGVWPEPTE